jgi:hypothetical protein
VVLKWSRPGRSPQLRQLIAVREPSRSGSVQLTPKVGVVPLVRPSDFVHHRRELRDLFGHEIHGLPRLARVEVNPRLIPNLLSGRLSREVALNAQRAGKVEGLPLAEHYGLRAERESDGCHLRTLAVHGKARVRPRPAPSEHHTRQTTETRRLGNPLAANVGSVELISELVLRSIAAHESKGRNGPTLDDVAADLEIPPVFGYDRLNERLQRQVVLGRVSSDGEHFRLTATGRLAVSA